MKDFKVFDLRFDDGMPKSPRKQIFRSFQVNYRDFRNSARLPSSGQLKKKIKREQYWGGRGVRIVGFNLEIGLRNPPGEAEDCGKGPSWVGEGGVLPPSTAPCPKIIKRQVLSAFLIVLVSHVLRVSSFLTVLGAVLVDLVVVLVVLVVKKRNQKQV